MSRLYLACAEPAQDFTYHNHSFNYDIPLVCVHQYCPADATCVHCIILFICTVLFAQLKLKQVQIQVWDVKSCKSSWSTAAAESRPRGTSCNSVLFQSYLSRGLLLLSMFIINSSQLISSLVYLDFGKKKWKCLPRFPEAPPPSDFLWMSYSQRTLGVCRRNREKLLAVSRWTRWHKSRPVSFKNN